MSDTICFECGSTFDSRNPESVESGRCEYCYGLKIEKDAFQERIKELESENARIKKLEGLLRTSRVLHEGYCEAGCAECEQGKEKADCHIGSHLHDIRAALGEKV